jgi:hypothetical protein
MKVIRVDRKLRKDTKEDYTTFLRIRREFLYKKLDEVKEAKQKQQLESEDNEIIDLEDQSKTINA